MAGLVVRELSSLKRKRTFKLLCDPARQSFKPINRVFQVDFISPPSPRLTRKGFVETSACNQIFWTLVKKEIYKPLVLIRRRVLIFLNTTDSRELYPLLFLSYTFEFILRLCKITQARFLASNFSKSSF
jgi:hypothetical protein